MSTVGERLKEERERLGLSQTEFGKLANVKKQAQLKYEKGDRSPGSDYLALIAGSADVLYILTGRRDTTQLAPDEAALLNSYRRAPEAVKRAIFGAAQGGENHAETTSTQKYAVTTNHGQVGDCMTNHFHERRK